MKGKGSVYQFVLEECTATGACMPSGITQSYLLPSRGSTPALTPAGTWFIHQLRMKGWVDLSRRRQATCPESLQKCRVKLEFHGTSFPRSILVTSSRGSSRWSIIDNCCCRLSTTTVGDSERVVTKLFQVHWVLDKVTEENVLLFLKISRDLIKHSVSRVKYVC